MNYITSGFDKVKDGARYFHSMTVKHYKVTFSVYGIGVIALIISAILRGI